MVCEFLYKFLLSSRVLSLSSPSTFILLQWTVYLFYSTHIQPKHWQTSSFLTLAYSLLDQTCGNISWFFCNVRLQYHTCVRIKTCQNVPNYISTPLLKNSSSTASSSRWCSPVPDRKGKLYEEVQHRDMLRLSPSLPFIKICLWLRNCIFLFFPPHNMNLKTFEVMFATQPDDRSDYPTSF